MIPVKPVKKPQNRTHNISTPLQKLAQKENFALFQIKGMKGHLYPIGFAANDKLIQKELLSIRDSLNFIETYIKSVQSDRIRARKKS